MNAPLKFSALALFLESARIQAFCPLHPVRTIQTPHQTIKLWDFLGEEILEECIHVFHDGILPYPECFPSVGSSPTVLVHHQEQPIQIEEEDCEDDSYLELYPSDVLFWVA
mmetsp:Transcript_12794/g.24318  ORF Transcript_12794/g.24318 Transcript_12794/m.24318 type:complete len:111 (-) Transcript_12794:220-552(-)